QQKRQQQLQQKQQKQQQMFSAERSRRLPISEPSSPGSSSKASSSGSSTTTSHSSSSDSSSEDEVVRKKPAPVVKQVVSRPPRATPGSPAAQATRQRLEELRISLEAVRQAASGINDAKVMPILHELEAIDSSGRIDARMLHQTRINAELNRAWWRREAHGKVSLLSATLVLKWMARSDEAAKPGKAVT
ncbi:unnamed protein product, partial [Polarella glacialis]